MNIAVIFGGKSCEHDVSVITGFQCQKALQNKNHNLIPLYISQEGEFFKLKRFDSPSDIYGKKKRVSVAVPKSELKGFLYKTKIDCAIVCCHGGNGENGALQGLLEMADVPYTSPDVFASALGMNKALSKAVATAFGIRTLDDLCVDKAAFSENPNEEIEKIERKLGYPVMVKPCFGGSSVGASLALSREKLFEALSLCFLFDTKAIVERGLTDFYELNVSAFRSELDTRVSAIERPLRESEILSFADKYLGSQKKGMASLKREVPANISEELKGETENAAITLYDKMQMSGVVRFDFLVEGETLYFNEVNTIPGSMSFYLWREKDVPFSELLINAVSSALARHTAKKGLVRNSPTKLFYKEK